MKMTLQVEMNILPEVAASISPFVEQALDHAIVTAWEVADPLTPVDTGALRGNVVVNKSPGRREMIWNQEYAIYQEWGTSRGVPANLFATRGADAAREVLDTQIGKWVP